LSWDDEGRPGQLMVDGDLDFKSEEQAQLPRQAEQATSKANVMS